MASFDYLTRVDRSLDSIPAADWNSLLKRQTHPTPFMRHEYLRALHDSLSATPATGWSPQVISLWAGAELQAACVLYLKTHSRGEYVFDWAWADAYHRHGLDYYPKALIAVPFTPVPGSRLLAKDVHARQRLLEAVLQACKDSGVSSLHLLFGSQDDLSACEHAGLMMRHNVQFHWVNDQYRDFEDFLGRLSQERRKKIRQERKKVSQAGVTFRWAQGSDITPNDWAFFYRCYEQTYREHGNPPYLTPAFFDLQRTDQPENWLLFIAERQGQAIASSLIGLSSEHDSPAGRIAYGRYWGALERVDCLHFEACYYQPLQWCIEHGIERFEGGAQGEHKMARALMPTPTTSAHWIAHPGFAQAVQHFLEREAQGVDAYLSDLQEHTPFKKAQGSI